MQELNTKTIRDIALEYPQTTRVFEEFKIDYCCGGRKPLSEACTNAGIDQNVVWKKLEDAIEGVEEEKVSDFPEHKKAAELTDYIISKHHVFTVDEIRRLTPLMDKVCGKHGPQHPELIEIQKAFQALCDELEPHMRKEEMVLFPYIKVLAAVVSTSIPVAEPHFITVQNPVRMMMTEHDSAGDLLKEMRDLSKDYSIPEGACPSYRALYFGLEELEKDLHRHIHLENNVLFPQAIELEVRVMGEAGKETSEEFACRTSCG
ncbi:MAG: iron-sulfur cluster repair di-iron protein [Pyrinomonadaceae bacterium]